MGSKTRKKRKKIVGKVFLVIGLILSISIGSLAATVVHKSDSMLGLINYDEKKRFRRYGLIPV